MLATDGIVFAADTEQTYGGEIKGTGSKIWAVEQHPAGNTALVVTGSGFTGYVEAIRTQISGTVFASPTDPLAGIQDVLAQFYSHHVLPFGENAPDFDLLIGINCQGHRFFISTCKSAVKFGTPFEAIGVGSPYASMLLNNYYRPMTSESAVLTCCKVVLAVKDVVKDCGKRTQIVVLKNGMIRGVDPKLIAEMEFFLDHHSRFMAESFKCIVGANTEQPFKSISRAMKALHRDADKLLVAIGKGIASPATAQGQGPTSLP